MSSENPFPCKIDKCDAYSLASGVIPLCTSEESFRSLSSQGNISCVDPVYAYGNTEEVIEYLYGSPRRGPTGQTNLLARACSSCSGTNTDR